MYSYILTVNKPVLTLVYVTLSEVNVQWDVFGMIM